MTWFQLFLLVAMIAVFWLLIIRPARVRREAHQRLIASLAPGMRVMTAGGVFGTLVEVQPGRVRVEVAAGVVLEMVPDAIAEVVPSGPTSGDVAAAVAGTGPSEAPGRGTGADIRPGPEPAVVEPPDPPAPSGEVQPPRSDGSSATAPEADRG